MFDQMIGNLAKTFGTSEINVALLTGVGIGFLLRSVLRRPRQNVEVSSPLAQSVGQGISSVSFGQSSNSMSGSFPKDSSGTSPDGNSFNRLVVTVQGKEVQINGEKILEEIQKGNLISAIKILRQETGFGLKESKDLIDALGKVHPTKK